MIKEKSTIKLSIIIPVYRSELTLNSLYQKITGVARKFKYSYEIIFVDDSSDDLSWTVLLDIQKRDRRVKIIQLTRNFGQHNALMCGFAHAYGDYIITLDDDLQNPPEEIPKIINMMKSGFDVVYGEYYEKKHNLFRNLGSWLIQTLYKKIFSVNGNLTSFRIIKSEIVKGLLEYKKNYTFIDGLIAWQTKNIGYVLVKHDNRRDGKSGYTLRKLILLSLNMVTNFSIFPLQMASIMGFVMSFLGMIMAVYIIFKKLIYGIPVTGFASTIVTITLFSGTQLITIGLIGEYIGRIHLNVNNKPQYRIRKIID
jgi:polyisoprenyl-phosphate glycosyltransferase